MIEIDGLYFPDLMDDIYSPIPGTLRYDYMKCKEAMLDFGNAYAVEFKEAVKRVKQAMRIGKW